MGSATSPPPHWLERSKVSRRSSLASASRRGVALNRGLVVVGLLLAFVVVIEFQAFTSAGATVQTEADGLAAIVRDSYAFDDPAGTNLRAAIGAYALVVTEQPVEPVAPRGALRALRQDRLHHGGIRRGTRTHRRNGAYRALRNHRRARTAHRDRSS